MRTKVSKGKCPLFLDIDIWLIEPLLLSFVLVVNLVEKQFGLYLAS